MKPNFDMKALLGADGRWVTADPNSVPAGRYAKEALTKLGVWDFAQTRLVSAENVRVALAFVERGEVNAGVVYETDAAISQKVRVAGFFPADSYTPVTYPIAVDCEERHARGARVSELSQRPGSARGVQEVRFQCSVGTFADVDRIRTRSAEAEPAGGIHRGAARLAVRDLLCVAAGALRFSRQDTARHDRALAAGAAAGRGRLLPAGRARHARAGGRLAATKPSACG